MATKGQADTQVRVTTTSATAAFQDISNQVMEITGLKAEALVEESDAFGDSWRENLYTGIRRQDDIVLSGILDDVAASGVKAIFGQATDLGAERVIKVNVTTASGVRKTDVIVLSYEDQPTRGALTRFQVTLRPTGALTLTSTT